MSSMIESFSDILKLFKTNLSDENNLSTLTCVGGKLFLYQYVNTFSCVGKSGSFKKPIQEFFN